MTFRWLVLAMAAGYVVLKLGDIGYGFCDENTYFAMARLVTEGRLPYRDFFYAHLPGRLLPATVVYALFGFHFVALKLLPLMATAATGGLVAYVGRTSGGFATGIGAAAVYFTSFGALYYGGFYIGPELAGLGMVSSLLLFLRGRVVASGILMALACTVGLYSICGAIALVSWALLNRRPVLRWTLVLAGVVALVFCALWVAFGSTFFQQVVTYHAQKVSDATNPKGEVLVLTLRLNASLLAAGALALWFRTRRVVHCESMALAFLAALAFYASVHDFYFSLCVPFLSVAVADGILAALRRLRWGPVGALLLLLVVTGFEGTRNRMHARGSVDFSALPQAELIARDVAEISPPGSPLFGDPEVVPLIALLSGRPILNEEADSNGKRYALGFIDRQRTLAGLLSDIPVVVIIREREVARGVVVHSGPAIDPAIRECLAQQYVPVRVYRRANESGETMLLLLRRPQEPEVPPPGPEGKSTESAPAPHPRGDGE